MFQNNTWFAPSSTLTKKITDYAAYAVFVRGDRTICLSQATGAIPVPTTLRASGIVSVGAVTKNHGALTGEYILEGNPYASSIDALPMTIRSDGIVPETFWIWDPAYGDNGGYVAYSHGVITPLTPHYQTAEDVRTIQSGQGFMVRATGPIQTCMFEEADKVVSQSSLVFGRPLQSNVIHVQLLKNATVIDGVAIRRAVHSEDTAHTTLSKLWKFTGEGMALIGNNRAYAIETRLQKNRDTFSLEFKQLRPRTYTLELFGSSEFPSWLIDTMLHQVLPIQDTIRYDFTVAVSDSASFVGRFKIVCDIPPAVNRNSRISIYPNPVRNTLSIKGLMVPARVRIFDITGRVRWEGSAMQIDCKSLSPGIYVISINDQIVRFEKL